MNGALFSGLTMDTILHYTTEEQSPGGIKERERERERERDGIDSIAARERERDIWMEERGERENLLHQQ